MPPVRQEKDAFAVLFCLYLYEKKNRKRTKTKTNPIQVKRVYRSVWFILAVVMICSVISPGTPDRRVKTPRGPKKRGRQVVESIEVLLSAYVSTSFLHSSPWAKSGVCMRCYLRPWIQESLSGWVKHAHSLTVILCSSHSSHPSFPTTISIALGKLL